jgi:hypothetical protein
MLGRSRKSGHKKARIKRAQKNPPKRVGVSRAGSGFFDDDLNIIRQTDFDPFHCLNVIVEGFNNSAKNGIGASDGDFHFDIL